MIAHYSHSHLGLCRKHFAIASKITIPGIEAGFAVLYLFTWQFKAEKRVTVIYNVFYLGRIAATARCGLLLQTQ